MKTVNPASWERGVGFSHGVSTEGESLFYIAGVIGADMTTGKLADGGVVPQFKQAMANIAELLREAGSSPQQVIFLRIYCIDADDYRSHLRELSGPFKETFQGHYPAMTFLEIKGLFSPGALLEIDGVAAR